MSEPRDRDWDDELGSLGEVREAYRAAVRDEAPTEELDAAILAASRRAVGAAPRAARPGGLARWRAPLAAAAVVVLSVSVAWWWLDDWRLAPSAMVYDVEEPQGRPAATAPEPAHVADAATGVHREQEERQRVEDGARKAGSAAVRSAEVGLAQAEITGRSKRRAEIAMAENAARDPGHAAQASRSAEAARETLAPPEAGPTTLEGGEEAPGRAAREARVAAPLPSAEGTPISAAPAAPESARVDAEAAPPGEALPPVSRETVVAAAPPAAARTPSRPGDEGAAAGEPSRLRALSTPLAMTRGAPAAEHAKASPATAAAPRIGGHDDGVAELREILVLWEAGRRDEASLALGRLRCAKPHVPIPPDLPVPTPKPLRCPDGAPAAKEALPGDR